MDSSRIPCFTACSAVEPYQAQQRCARFDSVRFTSSPARTPERHPMHSGRASVWPPQQAHQNSSWAQGQRRLRLGDYRWLTSWSGVSVS